MDDTRVDREKLIIPALAPLYEKLGPLAYAFMRFSAGAVLVPHGIQKLMNNWVVKGAGNIEAASLPFPTLLAWLTVFAESVAAICLAIGLFTRVAAVIIWIEMAVIITVFQWKFGYFWTSRGIEYALLWWLLCTAIMMRGGGRYSVDHYLGREF
jgi:putative oxidoreductase